MICCNIIILCLLFGPLPTAKVHVIGKWVQHWERTMSCHGQNIEFVPLKHKSARLVSLVRLDINQILILITILAPTNIKNLLIEFRTNKMLPNGDLYFSRKFIVDFCCASPGAFFFFFLPHFLDLSERMTVTPSSSSSSQYKG